MHGTEKQIAFGGFVTVEPAKHFALQAELLYSPRPGFGAFSSFPAEDSNTGEPLLIEQRIDVAPTHLELPILAKLLLPLSETNRVRLYATAGPSVALLLGCSGTIHSDVVSLITGNVVAETKEEFDCDDDWKSTDVSLVFGGGIDLAVGDVGRLILDARYLLGLSTYSTQGTSDIKNRMFAVTVGFGYGIKR